MAEFKESINAAELVQESTPDKTPSPQFLCVDETKRPRANSDPVGLHIHISTVPEITVTGDDCRTGGRSDDDESDSFLIPPSARRRANTCPDDMFRTRKGRPPTPPPTDLRILRSPAGKRFSFNFVSKDISSISFAHHRLSKVSEEKVEQQHKGNAVSRCGLSYSCSSSYSKTHDICTPRTGGMCPRLQSHPGDTEHACDQGVSKQVRSMSLAEGSVGKKPLTDMVSNTELLTSSPDSWRSTDNSRDSLDSKSLAAY